MAKFTYEAQSGVGFVVTNTPNGHKVPVAAIPSILSATDQAAIGEWMATALNASTESASEVQAIADLDHAGELIALREMLETD